MTADTHHGADNSHISFRSSMDQSHKNDQHEDYLKEASVGVVLSSMSHSYEPLDVETSLDSHLIEANFYLEINYLHESCHSDSDVPSDSVGRIFDRFNVEYPFS